MKLSRDSLNRITGEESEGKVIEIMPILYDASGTPMMLPAATWEVPSWTLGYHDNHVLRMPCTLWTPYHWPIPGTNSNASTELGFMVRVMERWPDVAPGAGPTIDMDAAMAIMGAIRRAAGK